MLLRRNTAKKTDPDVYSFEYVVPSSARQSDYLVVTTNTVCNDKEKKADMDPQF